MTESIIVYRNPAEAAMWESISDGTAFPLILAICGAALAFALVYGGVDDIVRRKFGWHTPRWAESGIMVLSICCSILVFWLVMHFMG